MGITEGKLGGEAGRGVVGSKVNAQGTDRVGIHVESNDRLRGGEMIATIKSAVYFKGKERRGVDPGSRVSACGYGFRSGCKVCDGILILYSELCD